MHLMSSNVLRYATDSTKNVRGRWYDDIVFLILNWWRWDADSSSVLLYPGDDDHDEIKEEAFHFLAYQYYQCCT